jgi:hypothetical protein
LIAAAEDVVGGEELADGVDIAANDETDDESNNEACKSLGADEAVATGEEASP